MLTQRAHTSAAGSHVLRSAAEDPRLSHPLARLAPPLPDFRVAVEPVRSVAHDVFVVVVMAAFGLAFATVLGLEVLQ